MRKLGCFELGMGRQVKEWPQPGVEDSWDGYERSYRKMENPRVWRCGLAHTAGAGDWGTVPAWQSH